MPDVQVAVVTYRSDAVLDRCLESLSAHEPHAPVLVVDNASPRRPVVPPAVELLPLERNVGFGAACNRAALSSDPRCEFLVFLNPDTRLLGPSLTELIDAMRERPDVGIATGPLIDDVGRRVPSAWGAPSLPRALWAGTGWKLPRLRAAVGRLWQAGAGASGASMRRRRLDVDGHVIGGAMAVRRTCFEQVGGFDEAFFLFWEDADICRRAREAGWTVALLSCTPIEHAEGTSSAGVGSQQRWRWYLDGARTYGRKHMPWWRRRALLAALRVGRLLRRRR